jgi:molybdopterin biosynthesis enzyme
VLVQDLLVAPIELPPFTNSAVDGYAVRFADVAAGGGDSNGEPRFFSPHGLRHLCGIELSHAGCSAEQVAAVLGHESSDQAAVYMKQAQRDILARDAQAKRDAMYAREVREAAIDAAYNVARLRGAR